VIDNPEPNAVSSYIMIIDLLDGMGKPANCLIIIVTEGGVVAAEMV